jgi:DNA-binding transcriptional regulator YhcF (GntR family)
MEFKTNIPIYLQVIEDIKQKIIAGTDPSLMPASNRRFAIAALAFVAPVSNSFL